MAIKRLRDLLTNKSKINYFLWKFLRSSSNITVELITGEYLDLRAKPFDDVDTAYEIYAEKVYISPCVLEDKSINLIIDLGANVGLSCVYFAHKYPNAKIIAFEPHPEHVKRANHNIELNKLNSKNISLVAAAASNQNGDGFLTDSGVCSAVVSQKIDGAIPIKLLDIFEYLKNMKIDILKIDIEGGEFLLLNDPRFKDIQTKAIVLEYHITPDYPDASSWCQQKPADYGYHVQPGAWNGSENGFLWAYNN